MKLLLRTFLFSLVVSSSTLYTVVAQSGWVKPKNELYLQLGYQGLQSDSYYTVLGDALTTNAFRQHSVYAYAEYGITERLDVLFSMPLYRFNSFETTTWAHGVGDARIELKYGVLQGPVPVSLSVGPEVPLAKGDNFATNRVNTFEQINLPTGDGEWNFWTTLAASHSFYPVPLYAQGYVAYNYRTRYEEVQFRDQIQYGVEVGYQPGERWWIIARGTGFVTLGEPDGFTEFVRGDGTEYMAAGLTVTYQLDEVWSLVVQGQTYFDGWHLRTNLYSAPVFSAGVAMQLPLGKEE